jgi:hypothetical protein
LKSWNNHNNFRHLLIAIIFGTATFACSGPDELGMELLPSTDLISVRSLVDSYIPAYTFSEDSIRTDETTKSLMGSFVDPIFGKTTIDLACQFGLTANPAFKPDAIADSIFLYLYYREMYGDTLTRQRLKVYELEDDIYVDKYNNAGHTGIYYENENLASYANNKLLGECEFVPRWRVQYDSVYGSFDTLYQEIKIPIDMSLAQKLISADSLQMDGKDKFLQYFKGLYVAVEPVAQNGTILSLELIANSNMNGSALLMHYHQYNTTTSKLDTLSAAYIPTEFTARINSYKHDYSATPIKNIINNEQEVSNRIYLQSTGGLRSKLFIPGLDTWKDSSNVAINKAELVFNVDSVASDPTVYELPKQLLLTIIDSTGTEYLPLDYSFSPTFYGGQLDTTDYTYRFNITQHMQEVVKGKFKNSGFYLSTTKKNYEFRRVILLGSGVTNGVQLKIAYSKILQ